MLWADDVYRGQGAHLSFRVDFLDVPVGFVEQVNVVDLVIGFDVLEREAHTLNILRSL